MFVIKEFFVDRFDCEVAVLCRPSIPPIAGLLSGNILLLLVGGVADDFNNRSLADISLTLPILPIPNRSRSIGCDISLPLIIELKAISIC